MLAATVLRRLVSGALLLLVPTGASAETLKIASGQRGAWDSGVSEIGQRAGIFAKHGLQLEILYTQGSGETQQAVLSGSVDIGTSVGTASAMSAFAKGAPIRIIGTVITGAADLYYYVASDSPLKTLADAKDSTIAYSTAGSSTQAIANAFVSEKGYKLKLVATGSPASTLTQVLSRQVDIGWGSPPAGFEQMDKGQIRIIASGNDTSFKNVSPRIIATTAATLQNKRHALTRYMDAYRETVRFMSGDDKALDVYATWMDYPPALARRTRDAFFPAGSMNPDAIAGIDQIMSDAVKYKFLSAPLTEAQLKELIQIPPANTARP